MYRNLFGAFMDDANDLMNEFNELNELFSEPQQDKKGCDKEKCEPKCKSYYHYVCDKFKNGENVYHKEKEVKDGKVLKDEGHGCGYISNNDETSIKSDSECKKNCTENSKIKEYGKAVINENELLKQKNCKLRSYINKLEGECEECKHEICELKKENEELRRKFDAIKSMF